MEVKTFENMIIDARTDLYIWLCNKCSVENQGDKNDLKQKLKNYLDQCCSEFEEETLKENLKEEFQDYLESLKTAKGE